MKPRTTSASDVFLQFVCDNLEYRIEDKQRKNDLFAYSPDIGALSKTSKQVYQEAYCYHVQASNEFYSYRCHPGSKYSATFGREQDTGTSHRNATSRSGAGQQHGCAAYEQRRRPIACRFGSSYDSTVAEKALELHSHGD